MAIQFSPFLLISFLSVLISFSLFNASMAVHTEDSGVSPAPQGYIPRDPNDPTVIAAAQFAVDEYNKEETKTVKFDNVYRAAAQNFGENKYEYALVINGEENNVANRYSAVVLEEVGGRKLLAFRRSI